MTVSDFENFKTNFFEQLSKGNKKCLKVIDDNKKLVEYYINSKDLTYVKIFLNDFNNLVLNPRFEQYKLLKSVLEHPLLTPVANQFRESDVLVKACKKGNRNAVEWLLKMDINLGVQDELGRTALMYAVRSTSMDYIVKKIMKTKGKHILAVDNKGNNALFFATENMLTFREFLKYKENYDFNYKNNDGENAIMFSCRYGKITQEEYFEYLCKYMEVDPEYTNIEGKTVPMYLAEHFKYRELKWMFKKYNIDPNFKSKLGHTLFSCLVKKYYENYSKVITETKGFGYNYSFFKSALVTFVILTEMGCNINEPIDEEGTKATEILLKLKDVITYGYLVSKGAEEINCFIEDNKNPDNKYPGVDITDPTIQENIKTSQKWLKEGLKDNEDQTMAYLSDLANRNWFYDSSPTTLIMLNTVKSAINAVKSKN